MFAKTFTLFALLAAVKAGPQFSYYSNPHIGAQSEATLRGFGGLSSVSKQSKAVDSPFSSVRKTDVRVTNDAVYASPQYAQLGAQVAYQQSPVAYAQQAYAAAPAVVAKAVAPAQVAYAQQAPVAYAQEGPVAYAQQAPVAYAQEGPVAYAQEGVAYAQGPVAYAQQVPQQLAYQAAGPAAVSYASNTISGSPTYNAVVNPAVAKVHPAPRPSLQQLAYGNGPQIAYQHAPAAAYATKTISGSQVAPAGGVQYAAAPAQVAYAQPQLTYAQQPLAYQTAVATPAVAKVYAQAPSVSYSQPQAYASFAKLQAAPSYAAQSVAKTNLLGVAYSAVAPGVASYNFNGYGVNYGY